MLGNDLMELVRMDRSTLLMLIIAGVFLIGAFFAVVGIWLVYLSSKGDSQIQLFGQSLKTANAGVAAIFFGSVTIILIIRQTLSIISTMPDMEKIQPQTSLRR
jgi:hypothetical protein